MLGTQVSLTQHRTRAAASYEPQCGSTGLAKVPASNQQMQNLRRPCTPPPDNITNKKQDKSYAPSISRIRSTNKALAPFRP